MSDTAAVTAPKRHQRRRSRSWTKPPGAVYVGRPTKWGNPYKVGGRTGYLDEERGEWVSVPIPDLDTAVRLYRELVAGDDAFQQAVRSKLAGKDLLCWCPLDLPCHADVLLEIANRAPGVE